MVSPLEDGLLQGAVAEESSERPCQDDVGTEDGEGRGLLITGAALPYGAGHVSRTKICTVTCKDQVRSEDP